MKAEEILSVIVPIYNASQYLHECVESILNQTYKNLDIILIDDGSTDDSSEICDRLAETDGRIRVCHIENRGVIAARNYGVDRARGDIITFVDSDDWIEPDMYLHMLGVYDKYMPDIISSGIIYDDRHGNRTVECDLVLEGLYDREQIEKEIIPVMMYDIEVHRRAVVSSVCSKLIKKNLWKVSTREIDSEITYGEDAAVLYPCLAKAEKAFFINYAWYHYCINNSSMVHSFDLDSFGKIKCLMTYLEKIYNKLCIWPDMERQLKEYIKHFLYPAIENVYGIKLGEPMYLFPYELVRGNSRVVIYGAGKVGRSYMNNLSKTNYVDVVAWVDSAYDKLSSLKFQVNSPSIISAISFDFIVIAIEQKETAMNVWRSLVSMGVGYNQIIWKKPEMLE